MKRSTQNPSSCEGEDTSSRRNRRQALALGGAAAAAAAVAALGVDGGKKAHAAPGDPLILGQPNDAGTNETSLTANVVGLSAVLDVINSDAGLFSAGVRGVTHAEDGAGVLGEHINVAGAGFGVVGRGGLHGVQGTSETLGVYGRGEVTGVYAESPGESPSLKAFSGSCEGGCVPDDGLALDVIGKAQFSTAGAGEVAAGAAVAIVLNPAVTADSHVTVTFTGNPGRARVGWVQRFAGAGFILRLAGGLPASNVPFTYLIVEPGELPGA